MSEAKQTPINLPQREVLNQMQIDTLLRTINTLTMTLGQMDNCKDDETSIYKEAGLSAEVSLMAACARLDILLADNNRWDLSALQGAEQKLIELYEANTKLLNVRSAVEAGAMVPHMKYKPVILRMGDGWAAVYGDPEFLDKALVGYGDTPEKALKCFDLLFEGKISDDLVNWLKQHTDYGKPTSAVDGSGDSRPETTEEGGSVGDGDKQTPPSVS